MNFVTIHITLVNITFCGTFKIRLCSVNDKLFKGVEVKLMQQFKQLIEIINLICQVCLSDCPDLDFELGGVGAVLQIPGLHHVLR